MSIHGQVRPYIGVALAVIGFAASTATMKAGPFILSGTDADDHGSFGSGANQDGWFFMQRSLENLAPGVTNGSKVVAILGSNVGSTAQSAALSAFNNSSLPGLGWSAVTYNDGALTTFLQGGLANTGIVMMDSANNVTGGAVAAELAAFTANANNINTFLGNGGGLFSQANGYGWVTALVPGLMHVDSSATGLGLTAAGTAAFPGLTNQDLSAGPWHNYFTNVGAIPILATATAGTVGQIGQAVIIGSSGGSVTNPDPPRGVPDSGSFSLVYLSLVGLMVWARRRMG